MKSNSLKAKEEHIILALKSSKSDTSLSSYLHHLYRTCREKLGLGE
jgi:hypothetical protein